MGSPGMGGEEWGPRSPASVTCPDYWMSSTALSQVSQSAKPWQRLPDGTGEGLMAFCWCEQRPALRGSGAGAQEGVWGSLWRSGLCCSLSLAV